MSYSSITPLDSLLEQLLDVLAILDTLPTGTIVFTTRREKGRIVSCKLEIVLHAVAEKKQIP